MELTFTMGSEMVIVKIDGRNILFSDQQTNFQNFAPIENLKFDEPGIIKEFPDLQGWDYGDMKEEATKRFKEKIKKMETENEVKNYITGELEGKGYILQTIRREGFRPIRVR